MVIYNGIDQADFSAMAAQDEMYLRDRGLEVPAGCTIGMVGLLTPLKGYHVAIDAFAKVLASYPDTSLWIVGSGNDQGYQERLGEQVKELGLDGKVLFTGYVREVGAIIENLSMLVSASTGPDALPRVLLEGMALGIPIVASAIGGIPEQVEDRVNGYLFEPGDAGALAECICELLGDPERVAAMGQAGKEIVRERFSLRRHVDGVESVYASLAT
jgi:glycosyltransferase involved in cell wall biosynthesis